MPGNAVKMVELEQGMSSNTVSGSATNIRDRRCLHSIEMLTKCGIE